MTTGIAMYTYTLIANSSSVLRSDGLTIPDDPSNTDWQAYLNWLQLGNLPAQPAQPTGIQLQYEFVAQCERAMQAQLDAGAQAWGYDSIVSAASYAPSTVAKFRAEAMALLGWRDQAWAWAEQLEADVLNGVAQQPATVEAFLALVPPQPTRPNGQM